jgi:Cof subfamily protein (haloacid dehalogenase superfamily)
MKVPRRRLYVSDLDGTLLDGQARLSAFSRAALTRLLSAGVAFTVATARSAQAVRTILGDLPTRLPIVEQNGACVTDLVTGRHLVVHELPLAPSRSVLEAFRAHGAEAIVAVIIDDVDRLVFEAPGNPGTAWYIAEKRQASDPRLLLPNDLHALTGGVLSVTTLVSETVARSLMAALSERLGAAVQIRLAHNHYAPGWWELSVLDARATKASAIAALRRTLELELADAELVVFGDAENDLDMLRSADIAVAVANATPELLGMATHVVESNLADGVTRWLLQQHAL